ncbi:hypothetical protein MIND_00291500 [Mycena indigotica]|uniref:DUF6532 domain-containing protein n=1 Tax=Mycena indigotica TaxID=2126181 RepID=A0A8H6WBM1_9AGAR|nr:uncharacterized protein MIND_00291500 [Mycena indigotica]KAF7312764.1 hypothetical protein MIND_00291500 [Mycena indigotica]
MYPGCQPTSAAKRKVAPASGNEFDGPSAKKTKSSLGGVSRNWRQVTALVKPPAAAATAWDRTIDRTVRATSTTSASSGAALDGETLDRFDDEAETLEDGVQATQRATVGAKTSQMGIVPHQKTLTVDDDIDDDAHERGRKPKYRLSDLPFHTQEHRALFKQRVVADVIDWAGCLAQPFAAAAHPDFKKIVKEAYEAVFSSDPESPFAITKAVYGVVSGALYTWRSELGKEALAIAGDILHEVPNDENGKPITLVPITPDIVAERAKNYLKNADFLYAGGAAHTGSYRSRFILEPLGRQHIRLAIQPRTDPNYGFPAGALALCAAAAQRALELWETGKLIQTMDDGHGKDKKLLFSGVDWTNTTTKYYNGIVQNLKSVQKQHLILDMAAPYTSLKRRAAADLLEASSRKTYSSAPQDPRQHIDVSDDEPEGDYTVGGN